MKTVNALKLRQTLGKILDEMAAGGEPVIVEKGHKQVAAVVPIEEFRRYFVDAITIERRKQIAREIEAMRQPATGGETAVQAIRALRGPLL